MAAAMADSGVRTQMAGNLAVIKWMTPCRSESGFTYSKFYPPAVWV